MRIWSIPDRKVVDWNDLHEMVTAACYTPDGQVSQKTGLLFQFIFGESPLKHKNVLIVMFVKL